MNQQTQQLIIPEEASRRLAISDPASSSAVIAELQRQKDMARDYIVPASKLRMHYTVRLGETPADNVYEPTLTFPLPALPGSRIGFRISKIAHEQLAERTTGQYYYRKLRSAAEHRDQMVTDINYWLDQLGDTLLLVRTLDDKVRALLSNRFFIIDNFDTMLHSAGVVNEIPEAIVQSVDVTDEKFFMRVLRIDHAVRLQQQADAVRSINGTMQGLFFRGIDDSQGHVAHTPGQAAIVQNEDMSGRWDAAGKAFQAIARDPDWIVPGVMIKNSEVGRGGLSIEPFFYQTYCSNTAIFGRAFGRIHRSGELDDMLTDNTRKLQRDAIFGEIRDVINATFDAETFRKHVDSFLGLQSEQLEEPAKSVEQLKKVDSSFTQDEQQAILNAMMTQGLGTTAYALVNAVTLYAHTQKDQDRRAELEMIGGRMIEKFPRELVTVRR